MINIIILTFYRTTPLITDNNVLISSYIMLKLDTPQPMIQVFKINLICN